MDIIVCEEMEKTGLDILAAAGSVHYDPLLWQDPARLGAMLAGARALVVRNRTRVTAGLLDGGSTLEVVGRLGVGLDNLELPALRERGIRLVSARGANAVAVAEFVFAYILRVMRRLDEADASVRHGGWERMLYGGREIYGLTIGIIGLGDIGRRVARRAGAFGMNVLAYDPLTGPFDEGPVELGVLLVEMGELLAGADFVSIHVPLTGSTHHLLGEREISLMKPSGHLIHTARGGVVDEDALFRALKDNRIAGCLLDVRENEPPQADDRFFNLPNVLLTPHVAGLTAEAGKRTALLVAGDVVRVLGNQAPRCPVW